MARNYPWLITRHLEAALRLARIAQRANPFEDAARGRDVAGSSDGGVEGHADSTLSIRADDRRPPLQVEKAGVESGPSEAAPRRLGRPRIGEVREKPWLTAEPPMSERTWYRRQREGRGSRHG